MAKRTAPATGSIPVRPGGTFLYRFFDKRGRLLYVGITRDLLRRGWTEVESQAWYCLAHRLDWELLPAGADALMIEQEAIRAEHPLHNINGKLPPEPGRERVWLCPPAVLPSDEELAVMEGHYLNLGGDL